MIRLADRGVSLRMARLDSLRPAVFIRFGLNASIHAADHEK